jgi:protein gp37
MNKTKIEWCDYTWNPIVGCKRGCPYCYAKKIYQRFNPDIPFDEISNRDERLEQPLKVKKPSKIFVGSMSDIEYWSVAQMNNVLNIVRKCPHHTFLFLTKSGETYGKYDFPINCWLGVTSVNERYCFKIRKDNEKNIKFLSIEPLLMKWSGYWLNSFIDWVIVGGLSPKGVHKDEWIEKIIKEARRLNIPVFLKNNLKYKNEIKEFPIT